MTRLTAQVINDDNSLTGRLISITNLTDRRKKGKTSLNITTFRVMFQAHPNESTNLVWGAFCFKNIVSLHIFLKNP